MSTNHRGDSYSKIITQRRSKELHNKEISTSFQQLYDLLSQKGKNLDRQKEEYRSEPKSNASRQFKSKVNINIAYQNHVQKRISSHQINTVARGSNNDSLTSKLEAFYKQRGSLTPNQKKTSTQTTNQRLKNIILGKRSRKSQFFQDKTHAEQFATPATKHEKLRPLNMQTLSKKRNLTTNSQQSMRILQKSMISQQQSQLSQYLNKVVKTEEHEQANHADLGGKYKKSNFNKRLMINGSHLVNLLKHSSKTSELKNVQSPNKKSLKEKKNAIELFQAQKNTTPQQQLDAKVKNCSPTQKMKKQEERQFIFGKALQKLPISEHIIWKIQKMLTFNLFFLKSFGCQIFYNDPRYLFKYHKSNNFFKYYVGGGNNRNLIVQTLRKRWWWKEVSSIEWADFVWTQQKNQKILNLSNTEQNKSEQPKNVKSISIINFSKFKQSIRKPLQKSNDRVLKRLLTHSYKIRKILKGQPMQIKEIATPQILHNHISNSNILGDKKSLFFLLKLWITSFKKQGKDQLFAFIPQTYHFKNTDSPEYLEYQQTCKNNTDLWIVKPGQNSNRGRGIFLSSQIEQIRESIEHRFAQGGTTIIQKYKTDLLLYKGRKFDIRTYMLCIIIRGVKKFFWYFQGYVRTSSHLFNLKQLNSMIHLTNDAIQNKGDMYGKFEKGNKLNYNQLQAYLNQTFAKKEWKVESLVNKMKEIAKGVVTASYPLVGKSKQQGFQLFGLDFIVDSSFNPWLLQVNTNPCLQVSAPVLQNIIPNVIQNLFRLAVDPLFPPSMLPDKQHEYSFPQKAIETNKFELVFDALSQRDQGWQTFCETNFNSQTI